MILQGYSPSKSMVGRWLGGGFYIFLIFYREPWGNDPIWRSYFSDGLELPTRWIFFLGWPIFIGKLLVSGRVFQCTMQKDIFQFVKNTDTKNNRNGQSSEINLNCSQNLGDLLYVSGEIRASYSLGLFQKPWRIPEPQFIKISWFM